MTIGFKWAKLSDDEKNKIIAEKIFGYSHVVNGTPLEDPVFGGTYRTYWLTPLGKSEHCIPNYLNWEGFGQLVEKLKDAGVEICYDTDTQNWVITFFMDDKTKGYHKNLWDAAAIAYLKMKGIET